MPKGKKQDSENASVGLTQTLLITELARAGVGQVQIRKVVGCGMNRVNEVVKPIEQERKRAAKAQAALVIKIEKKLDAIVRFSRKPPHV
jgi:nitrogen regulatory protein PII